MNTSQTPTLGEVAAFVRRWAETTQPSIPVRGLRFVVPTRKDAHAFVQAIAREVNLTDTETADFVAGKHFVKVSGLLVGVEWTKDISIEEELYGSSE
jgi:hypothetical protein